jgi:hypothetical protein
VSWKKKIEIVDVNQTETNTNPQIAKLKNTNVAHQTFQLPEKTTHNTRSSQSIQFARLGVNPTACKKNNGTVNPRSDFELRNCKKSSGSTLLQNCVPRNKPAWAKDKHIICKQSCVPTTFRSENISQNCKNGVRTHVCSNT